MRVTTLTAAFAMALTFAQTAHAREHHHYRHAAYARHGVFHQARRDIGAGGYSPWGGSDDQSAWSEQRSPAASFAWAAGATYHGGPGGRPRAWCGWEMRQLVGSDPGPQFNLARNWARWGQPGPAGVGAVVVWPHHVGKIVGQENGMWLIQSGNDGGRVRTRPLPIRGAIAIRWG